MRHIVIGDIHGCFDEFMELLGIVAPTDSDQIIAIGDTVDRGPDSEKVLEFFRDTPNAVSIMGNHERKHIRSARGEVRAAFGQKIVRQQCGERYAEWLAFMETFPRHVELPEAILVHGMFEPGVPLEQQKDTVVIGTLTGEHYMTKNYAGPWYEHYDGAKPMIVGHHDYLNQGGPPLIHNDLVYGLDTAVAHGGRLTAMILPEFRIVSVPARADHWAEQRRQYAVLTDSSKSDLDLDLEKLAEYARSADTSNLSPKQRERARQCAEIDAECRKLLKQIMAAAESLCEAILGDLRRTDHWNSVSSREQAARYAKRASKSPAAQLLFAVRSGKLTDEVVLRCAKTPRELEQLARYFGIDVESSGSEVTNRRIGMRPN
jgi:serine/threonine protein phosphatase 1